MHLHHYQCYSETNAAVLYCRAGSKANFCTLKFSLSYDKIGNVLKHLSILGIIQAKVVGFCSFKMQNLTMDPCSTRVHAALVFGMG